MITKTTSIMGAIWKPRLPSVWIKLRGAFLILLFTAENEMSVMPASAAGVHRLGNISRGHIAIAADDRAESRIRSGGNLFSPVRRAFLSGPTISAAF